MDVYPAPYIWTAAELNTNHLPELLGVGACQVKVGCKAGTLNIKFKFTLQDLYFLDSSCALIRKAILNEYTEFLPVPLVVTQLETSGSLLKA